jgi:hypothetical protein
VYNTLLKNYTGDVEVLFHTGKASLNEAKYWNMRPSLRTYYLSDMRDVEAHALQEVYNYNAK